MTLHGHTSISPMIYLETHTHYAPPTMHPLSSGYDLVIFNNSPLTCPIMMPLKKKQTSLKITCLHNLRRIIYLIKICQGIYTIG